MVRESLEDCGFIRGCFEFPQKLFLFDFGSEVVSDIQLAVLGLSMGSANDIDGCCVVCGDRARAVCGRCTFS